MSLPRKVERPQRVTRHRRIKALPNAAEPETVLRRAVPKLGVEGTRERLLRGFHRPSARMPNGRFIFRGLGRRPKRNRFGKAESRGEVRSNVDGSSLSDIPPPLPASSSFCAPYHGVSTM